MSTKKTAPHSQRSKAFDAVWDGVTSHVRLASELSANADEREAARLLLPRLQVQRAKLAKNVLRAK